MTKSEGQAGVADLASQSGAVTPLATEQPPATATATTSSTESTFYDEDPASAVAANEALSAHQEVETPTHPDGLGDQDLDQIIEDLVCRVEDWKNLKVETFGQLVRSGEYIITPGRGRTTKKYKIYLFEKMLLSVVNAKHGKATSRATEEVADRYTEPSKLRAKGRIFFVDVTKVVKTTEQGMYAPLFLAAVHPARLLHANNRDCGLRRHKIPYTSGLVEKCGCGNRSFRHLVRGRATGAALVRLFRGASGNSVLAKPA